MQRKGIAARMEALQTMIERSRESLRDIGKDGVD